METYSSVYLNARRRLREVGVTAYELESRLIVMHATGMSREELLSSSKKYLTNIKTQKSIEKMTERRIAGEPLAYIIGGWEFCGVPLIISNAVLVPRVDTEVIAEEAIRLLCETQGSPRLLDLCAGSGCIGLAVAANVPECRVVLADNSEDALAICRTNMLKNHLSGRVIAVMADALAKPSEKLGKFDMIVCNPPYIPTAVIAEVDISVRGFEPVAALDGGEDGLDFYKAIAKNWTAVLKDNGLLAFECGAGQAEVVCGIMAGSGLNYIRTVDDTLGIKRVVVGRKS